MQFRGHSLPVHHCPILSALIRPRDLFRLLAIGMCHFLSVHHLGIAFLGRVEGQNITYTYECIYIYVCMYIYVCQHPTRHLLYHHLPPITKTIQVRRTRYVGHSWRSRDELISDVLLWTPTYGRAKAGR